MYMGEFITVSHAVIYICNLIICRHIPGAYRFVNRLDFKSYFFVVIAYVYVLLAAGGTCYKIHSCALRKLDLLSTANKYIISAVFFSAVETVSYSAHIVGGAQQFPWQRESASL